MSRFRLAAALAALPLAACTALGPAYESPEVAMPAGYSAAAPVPAAAAATLPARWWTLFGDAALDRLVDEALGANQDLAAAAARVEEARALAGIARADQLPEVTVGVDASRTRLSRETLNLPPEVVIPLEIDRFRASANLFYELDFWGRLRRLTEAARAELLATEEGRRSVELGLVSEVAAAYFDLLAFDHQLQVVRDTLGSRGESVRLQRLRFDAGTISGLDLAQAEAELAATEATVPALERQVRLTEDRLAVLLGRIGGSVERGGALTAVAAPEVPVGLPSALLARRPDVVAAERRLAAANARIGAARAAYFPSIALTGFAGTESAELASLFGSGTGVWQAALGLVEPIFNAGRTRRQVEAARAREQQALAAYTRAVQGAFAEVEDALVARRTGAAEREILARQVEALARARRLAELRYEAGESSYLEVLDAERSLFRAELELSRARRNELAATVDLMRALGGGWETPAP
ncbi:MAG TPA: efflux transporter outer membrane subunit [Thermoanaerobaculia bacterium]|nr:efflux transporter outer membrane subunit [Thermoanaerobaculia bacterium]